MNILMENKRGSVRSSFLADEVTQELYSLGNVTENPYDRALTPDELAEWIRGKEVVLTGWGSEPISAEVMKNADCLKLHVHVGGSVAAYVSREEFDAGVTVISGNEIFARSVAEGCLCYILTALRRAPKYIRGMKERGWKEDSDLFFEGLLYKKVGIVGYGAIAKYFCEMLKPFNVELLIYSSHLKEKEGAKITTLDEIFSECDIISLHGAWNERTEGMIKKQHFDLIRDGALFVNTARAAITDEAAMLDALEGGRFQAVLDVYHREPLAMDSPLRQMDNVMLFPHMAGPTMDMRRQVGYALLEDIKRFMAGEPCLNVVTAEQAARMTIEKR